MPAREQLSSKAVCSILQRKPQSPRHQRQYATAAAAIVSAPYIEQMTHSPLPISRYPSTRPPSYKPPEFRKSQLLRQYASMLRSSPLTLLFQHNNLRSNEWVSVRRELVKALQKVDESRAVNGQPYEDLAGGIKLQIIQTGIFAAALRVVEYYKPEMQPTFTQSSDGLTHVLSQAAHDAVVDKKKSHQLAPLLSGPLVLLTFPTVSPQHMKAALSILSPSSPQFPAPTRKANPGWHENAVQTGLQKLLLLGARVEGKVFDVDGTKWIGGIEGGLEGLRSQLVAMLQGLGAEITNTLESAAKNLYFTVESRRTMLEDDHKDSTKVEAPKAACEAK